MRILYLLRYWPVFGGGETVTRTLANEMCRRGHEVGVVYLWDRTNDTDIYLDKNIKNIKIDGVINIKDGTIPKSEYRKVSSGLKNAFVSYSPDIIINQWIPSELVWKATKGMNVKVIKCHHSIIKYVPHITTLKQKIFYSVFGEKAGWMRVYPELRRDYIHSDTWIFLSQSSRRDALYLLRNADKKRLRVITNPLPYSIDKSKIDLCEKKKEVIFVGRIVQLKRLGYLLEAWKMIEDKVPDWTFRIVGDGDYAEVEKAKAKELNLSNIVFEGYQDAREYLLNGSILMMASNQEGFGMVVIEAQQCGCVPVVVDSYSTVHDIVTDGVDGVLVENNNIEKYAATILDLINNTERRHKMAAQAMKSSDKFSITEICNQWEKLFEEIEVQRK